VTVVSPTTFRLNGTNGTASGTYLSGGYWTKRTGVIATTTAVTVNNRIVVASTDHSLSTGDRILVSGVAGFGASNGRFTITVIDRNTFLLNGTAGVGPGAGTGGTWTKQFYSNYSSSHQTITVNAIDQVETFTRKGDDNFHREQGHVQIESNLVLDSRTRGILINNGARDAGASNLAHPGSVINTPTLNRS